jgi:replicative DNA helicase
MLRDNNVINDVVRFIRADNFYLDAHRTIYQAMVTLYNDRHQPVDLVTLAEFLREQQQIDNIGGYPYLGELWDAAPTAANILYYSRIVRDKAITRQLIRSSTEILRDAYEQATPADELLETAERKILEIAELGVTDQTSTLLESLRAAWDRIDTRTQQGHLAVSGVPTGYPELNELTAGLQNGELIIVAARPGVGKCLAHDAEIVLADGAVATIEEVFRQQQAKLLTLTDDWRLTWTQPSRYVDDGVKPVFRVTTRLGRQVECTQSHPFRTLAGWRPLAELTVGDRIAVPRRLEVEGREPARACEIKVLAYLIGDGTLTGTSPGFTNSNQRLLDDFTEAVADFGGVTVRVEDHAGRRTPTLYVTGDADFIAVHRPAFAEHLRGLLSEKGRTKKALAASLGVQPTLINHWTRSACVPNRATFAKLCELLEVEPRALAPHGLAAISRNSKNPVTLWLEALGLWGKNAHGKTIPAFVFRLPRAQLALFLNRLFATDGWATVLGTGNPQLGYATVSERLCRQIQHLLLRFGIIASLRQRTVRYREQLRECWQLDITDQDAIRTFVVQIGMFGKEAALARVEGALVGRKRNPNRDLIPLEAWDQLAVAKGAQSWNSLAKQSGLTDRTNIHVRRRGFSRARLERCAAVLEDEPLLRLARSDVYWDEIVSIEPRGLKQVYDLTIPETHNFVANDICVHNTSFALSLSRNIAIDEKAPVFLVSLEMSRIELAERMLSAQARVPNHKMRKGHLNSDDMQRLMVAAEQLRQGKMFIDDSPGQTMLRIAANARRLKLREGIRTVMIDYLQLIEPESRRDPRQEQVAQISRRLKILARELNLPVIALAQLNRGPEDRQDHKPRLSDLRESGCLAGDSLVTLADTGARVPIVELAGRSGFKVWALNEQTMKLEPATVTRAFATGRKPVFRLTTRLGRAIRATPNHRFLTENDWLRLDELVPGDRIALPAHQPGITSTRLKNGRAPQFPELLFDSPGLQAWDHGHSFHRVEAFRPFACAAKGLKAWPIKHGPSSPGLKAWASEQSTTVAESPDFDFVSWDPVIAIEPDGETDVYDLTVPGPANFIANDIIVHNSLEQDADVVMMLHRPELYGEVEKEGLVDIIIAKQRNGPTDTVHLAYLKEFMSFENFTAERPFEV